MSGKDVPASTDHNPAVARMPGPRGYWIAALLVLVGIAAAAFFLWRAFSGIDDSLTRATFPGQAELALSVPGTYTIFLEYPNAIAVDPAVADLGVELRSSDGLQVPLDPPSTSQTYTIGGRTGEAVLQFEVVEPGHYLFAGDYPAGQSGPEATLAVGRGFASRLFTGIGAAILVPLIAWSAAVAVAVLTFLRRRSPAAPS